MLTGRVPTPASKTNEKRQVDPSTAPAVQETGLFLGFKSANQHFSSSL